MTTMTTMTNANATAPFQGAEVNTGSVTMTAMGSSRMLVLSDDFRVPGAPAPHWQVTDTMGNTHLLRRLQTADGVVHRSIELPAFVGDVASVQIWCAFAEVELGRARLTR